MSLANYFEHVKEQSESNMPSAVAVKLQCRREIQVDFCAGIV
jgi:hypothetical protein